MKIWIAVASILITAIVLVFWYQNTTKPHYINLLGKDYIYKGGMKNGEAYGEGALYSKNETYPSLRVGSWVLHGGRIYEGSFDRDQLNGHGQLYLEGEEEPFYSGNFIDNIPNGKGIYYSLEQAREFSKEWGMERYSPFKEGEGFYDFVYFGEVKNGKPDGHGSIVRDSLNPITEQLSLLLQLETHSERVLTELNMDDQNVYYDYYEGTFDNGYLMIGEDFIKQLVSVAQPLLLEMNPFENFRLLSIAKLFQSPNLPAIEIVPAEGFVVYTNEKCYTEESEEIDCGFIGSASLLGPTNITIKYGSQTFTIPITVKEAPVEKNNVKQENYMNDDPYHSDWSDIYVEDGYDNPYGPPDSDQNGGWGAP